MPLDPEKIRSETDSAGLSDADVARRMDVNRHNYSRLLSRLRKGKDVNLGTAEAWARAIGVPLDAIRTDTLEPATLIV